MTIKPLVTSIEEGGEAAVEVWAQDVANLYGAGFTLEFRAGVLTVVDADPNQDGVQIESGAWLSPRLEVVNTVANGYGRVEFFATQRYPATGRTGSGVIATIRFKAVAAGQSPLHFTAAQLVNDAGQEIPATPADGLVRVGGGTYLPLIVK